MNELLTTAEMAEADRQTIAGGRPGIELMEQAGRAVADAVIAQHAAGSRVTVVAGPGNNGGDGFVAARLLTERGYRVSVLFVGAYAQLKGDAALAAKSWPGGVSDDPGLLATADVLIDALFGAGLDRAVEGTARAVIETMNALAKPVVAVDLPSGVNGTSGAVLGAAVNATQTVTFFARNPATFCCPAGCIAAQFPWLTSVFRHRCWRGLARTHSRTRQSYGAAISRCRRMVAINTTAATQSSCRAPHGRPAPPGLRHAGLSGPEPAL